MVKRYFFIIFRIHINIKWSGYLKNQSYDSFTYFSWSELLIAMLWNYFAYENSLHISLTWTFRARFFSNNLDNRLEKVSYLLKQNFFFPRHEYFETVFDASLTICISYLCTNSNFVCLLAFHPKLYIPSTKAKKI